MRFSRITAMAKMTTMQPPPKPPVGRNLAALAVLLGLSGSVYAYTIRQMNQGDFLQEIQAEMDQIEDVVPVASSTSPASAER